MVEWVPSTKDGTVLRVDPKSLEVETEFGQRHTAAVLNMIPPQKAGLIAERAGTVDKSGWVPVRAQNFESSLVPGIHVVGDATIAVPMPKSAFCANAQAKVVAAAIVSSLAGKAAPRASWANTCYSLIAPDYGVSITGVFDVQGDKITEIKAAAGSVPGTRMPPFESARPNTARLGTRQSRWTLGERSPEIQPFQSQARTMKHAP